ncbi:MAG: glutamyl-tRNA reductase [Micrococcaceae bacterium]
MTFVAFIATHNTSELSVVEQLSYRNELIPSQLTARQDMVSGCVVLATCTRFEIYVDIEPKVKLAEAKTYIVEAVAEISKTKEDFVVKNLTLLKGTEAIEHLFSVAASLDSMAVGEREIVGQVRTALKESQTQRTTSPTIELTFQKALKVGKAVRTQTELANTGRSLVDLAVDLAMQMCTQTSKQTPEWGNNSALIIGTGAYAGATVAALRNSGCKNIEVFSRSNRAKGFAESHNIKAIKSAKLPEQIANAQLVVSCSGKGPIITINLVKEALELRSKRSPLVMIDMALRHDIHPLVNAMNNVEVINLETIKNNSTEEHSKALTQAQELVQKASEEFTATNEARFLNDAIVALRMSAKEILDNEIAKLPENVDKEEATKAMRRLTRSLLHTPTTRAKELAAKGEANDYAKSIETLFGIEF